MFETRGIINSSIVEELMNGDLPHLNRNTYIAVAGILFLATFYPFGSVGFTVVILCALLPIYINQSFRRRYIGINMQAIQMLTKGGETLEVETFFADDYAQMSFQGVEVKLLYHDFHKVIETASVYCISSIAHQAVYVFKNQLTSDQQKELFSFLQSKQTQIPEKQFTKLLK